MRKLRPERSCRAEIKNPSLPSFCPKTGYFLGSFVIAARLFWSGSSSFCTNICLFSLRLLSPNPQQGLQAGKEWNFSRLLRRLPRPALPRRGQVVDGRVLQHREEHEDEADPEVDVHGLDVGHAGHGGVHAGDDGGHGQHRGDPCNGQLQVSLWQAYTAAPFTFSLSYIQPELPRQISGSEVWGSAPKQPPPSPPGPLTACPLLLWAPWSWGSLWCDCQDPWFIPEGLLRCGI